MVNNNKYLLILYFFRHQFGGVEVNGKSWDHWVLEKAMADMKRMKLVKNQREAAQAKREKDAEERLKRQNQALENRECWVKKKTYELERQKREHLAQQEFEKLKVQAFFSSIFRLIKAFSLPQNGDFILLDIKELCNIDCDVFQRALK